MNIRVCSEVLIRRVQYSKSSSSGTIPIFGSLTPYMGIHKRFTWYLGVDKECIQRLYKFCMR